MIVWPPPITNSSNVIPSWQETIFTSPVAPVGAAPVVAEDCNIGEDWKVTESPLAVKNSASISFTVPVTVILSVPPTKTNALAPPALPIVTVLSPPVAIFIAWFTASLPILIAAADEFKDNAPAESRSNVDAVPTVIAPVLATLPSVNVPVEVPLFIAVLLFWSTFIFVGPKRVVVVNPSALPIPTVFVPVPVEILVATVPAATAPVCILTVWVPEVMVPVAILVNILPKVTPPVLTLTVLTESALVVAPSGPISIVSVTEAVTTVPPPTVIVLLAVGAISPKSIIAVSASLPISIPKLPAFNCNLPSAADASNVIP